MRVVHMLCWLSLTASAVADTDGKPAAPAPQDTIALVKDGACPGAITLHGSTLDAIPAGEVAWLPWTIGEGPFRLEATLVVDRFASEGAGIAIAGGILALDDPEHDVVLRGSRLGPPGPLAELRSLPARPGVPIRVIAQWDGRKLKVSSDGTEVASLALEGAAGRVGLAGPSASVRLLECTVAGQVKPLPVPSIIFSAADGVIDEHRDPIAAAGPDTIELFAVTVSTNDDGSLIHGVRRRTLRDGVLGPPQTVVLDSLDPHRITVGHDGAGWVMLAQPNSAQQLSTSLSVFTSSDGASWTPAGRIDAGNAPIRLVATGMQRRDGSVLEAAATRVVDGTPRACVIRRESGRWTITDLATQPSCDPVPAGPTGYSVRVPRMPERWITPQAQRQACPSTAQPAWLPGPDGGSYLLGNGPRNDRLVMAPIASGRPTWVYWDGPVGSCCTAQHAGSTWAIFEGGERAPREHILLLKLPE